MIYLDLSSLLTQFYNTILAISCLYLQFFTVMYVQL